MQQGMFIPQIDVNETKRFSQAWDSNGIAIVFDDVHLKFATDFANVCLRSAFTMIAQAAMAKAQQNKPEEKKAVIIEGE